MIAKGDRTPTGMLSYNRTSKPISFIVLNSHEQTSKSFQIPAKYIDDRLKRLGNSSCSVKAVSRNVPATNSPEQSAILMAQRQQEIKFKRGACSAELKGEVARGEVMIYLIGAKQGQTMNIEIQSVEVNAVFKVVDPNTNAVAEAEKSWSGKLTQTRQYQIVVGTERGGAS
ncbi:hypothetical protein IQ270_10400 [Microcoleus sp. LEGE 07076]|nr:hypothetical protein [Microcoleus sp. LEGE 07076]